MKRTLAIVLAIVLTLSLLPVTAAATPTATMEITHEPTVRTYAKGHVFAKTDLNGLEIRYREADTDPWITATYSATDPKFQIQSPAVGDKFDTAGEQVIHFHYVYGTDKYAEDNVRFTVKAAMFSDLEVTVAPTKGTYYVGETIDLAGMELTRKYTDGGTAPITDLNAANISFDPTKTTAFTTAGTEVPIKVTYTEDGTTVTEVVKKVTVLAAATALTLDKATASIAIGGTAEITASPTPATANLQWSIEDSAIATIAVNASDPKKVTVTGVSAGTTKVIARTMGSNIDKFCVITVTDGVAPTTIYLNYEATNTNPKEIPIGSTLLLQPIGFDPFITTKKDVTWSSSDATVATVSSTGLVSAKMNGTATITCTSTAASTVTKTCAIKVVDVPVTGISLSASAITLYASTVGTTVKGSSKTITASVQPSTASNKAITWTSGNPDIVTVDANGKITAVYDFTGKTETQTTATVTATAMGGITAKVTVVVKKATLLDELSVTPATASLYVGQTLTAAVSIHPSNATTQSVTWTVNAGGEDVVTVSSNGRITAIGQGTATVTATADDGSGLSDTVQVTVNNITVESVLMTATTATVLETKTVQLYASIYPSTATNKGVSWSSLNTAVATVSSSGVVTGVSKGNVVIRATAKDGSGNYADCVVTVEERTRVSSLSINYKSFTLILNDSTYLKATVLPSNATVQDVEWESSNPGVATVSSSGLLKGLALGTTVITANADGKSTSITVTVAESRSNYGVVVNCARRVNVRSVPNGSRGFLGYAYRGQTYKVIGESGNWYKIQYTSSKEAYIWKDYMSFDTATSYVSATSGTGAGTGTDTGTTSTPAPTITGSTVTVTNCRRRINVRATADPDGTHLGYAYLNDIFPYIATSGDWYQINFNGVVAYVHTAYCSLST